MIMNVFDIDLLPRTGLSGLNSWTLVWS